MKIFRNNWENYSEVKEIPSEMAVGAVSSTLKTAVGDRGSKVFELSNHLGNVLATVSDKKLGRVLDSTSIVAAYYEAQVQSAQDYYAFGWNIPSRKFNTGSYRHGFNGGEKDYEISEGIYTTLHRILDSRIGRWWTLDPIVSPSKSGYNSMSNNPTNKIDPNGDTDYFDQYGNFIGTDGKSDQGEDVIRVLTISYAMTIQGDGIEEYPDLSGKPELAVSFAKRSGIIGENGLVNNGRIVELTDKGIKNERLIDVEMKDGGEPLKVFQSILNYYFEDAGGDLSQLSNNTIHATLNPDSKFNAPIASTSSPGGVRGIWASFQFQLMLNPDGTKEVLSAKPKEHFNTASNMKSILHDHEYKGHFFKNYKRVLDKEGNDTGLYTDVSRNRLVNRHIHLIIYLQQFKKDNFKNTSKKYQEVARRTSKEYLYELEGKGYKPSVINKLKKQLREEYKNATGSDY